MTIRGMLKETEGRERRTCGTCTNAGADVFVRARAVERLASADIQYLRAP
jgi:hypothetical protein